MKGKLQINNITQKSEILSEDGKIYPLDDRFQGWHWLYDGCDVNYHLTNKYTTDDSKCKCKDKSYEDTLTCKHFVGGGINDCMQIDSIIHKVAALEWPRMTLEEMESVDSFALEFHKFASKYPDDEPTIEEILKEFKEINGLTKPRLW